ncbi:hypothetical protein L2E82_42822 [Cichorium intybus]|uniref:Uncharacterized protein n=1 Tax=Cichorium intybus TaxID=13427 RepID=A0ACB8ZLR8_CICIN|nr:hypothetical protein L2E82_42822 [Cichorium intybus]
MEWLYKSLLRYDSNSFILISSSPSFSVPPLFIGCDPPPSCIPPVYTYKGPKQNCYQQTSKGADGVADEIQSLLHIVKLNLFMLLSSFAFNCIQKSGKNTLCLLLVGFEPETETASSRWVVGARAAKNGEEGSEVFANSDAIPAKKDPQDGDETINGMADSGLQGKRICTAEWELTWLRTAISYDNHSPEVFGNDESPSTDVGFRFKTSHVMMIKRGHTASEIGLSAIPIFYQFAYAQLWKVLGLQMEEHKLDHLNNSSRGIKTTINALVNVGNGVEEKQKLCHQYEW